MNEYPKDNNVYTVKNDGRITGIVGRGNGKSTQDMDTMIDTLSEIQSVTSILNDGILVKIIVNGESIFGTIAGNDVYNSEGNLENLNYYIIPIGKTRNEEIMELCSNIEVLGSQGMDIDGEIVVDAVGDSYYISIKDGVSRKLTKQKGGIKS